MLRDLDDHPDLLEHVWGEVIANVYDEFAAWLTVQCERDIVDLADPAATGAVLVASLTAPPLMRALIDRVPGQVEPERYLEAWVRGALAALDAGQPNG